MFRLALAWLAAAALLAQGPKYGLGRVATPEEIRAVDISVTPDGAGLPPGQGTALQGRDVYERRCSKCHGAKGEGGENEVPLVGGQGSLKGPKPLKTVGSYWPHATTLWDYINRAMPHKEPGLLTAGQVYAVTAHVLHLNGIIGENEVMDAKSLPRVKMPNRGGFVKDPRPDTGKKPR
ncbi:MAG: cytochrome c [Candidatus Solibacter usitatus]|nr:cytochrome c [Candidatus Solibacter usitatus]